MSLERSSASRRVRGSDQVRKKIERKNREKDVF